jgi:hypothetical protein
MAKEGWGRGTWWARVAERSGDASCIRYSIHGFAARTDPIVSCIQLAVCRCLGPHVKAEQCMRE